MKEKIKNPNCINCQFDCPDFVSGDCENYKVGRNINEYVEIIRNENVNLHRLCDKFSLKHSVLIESLKNKRRLNFKYRSALENYLYESNEWIDWERNGCHTWNENIDER